MDRIIAYCGLVCSDCSAYVATQANDQEALERVAAQWREEYNAPNITVESVICDGCLDGGRLCSHCACEKLEKFFGFVPGARGVLDEIRHSL
jgi:hypothetical protein